MKNNKSLIVVDYQNDFANPEGSLYVEGGEKILEYINLLMQKTKNTAGNIISSQDWHPENHISFAASFNLPDYSAIDGNIKWPKHCVQNTLGADFLEGFNKDLLDKSVFKGYDPKIDSYSSFGGIDLKTGENLEQMLKNFNTSIVQIVGLATDYCVAATANEAIDLGFKVEIHTKGIAGVNVNKDDSKNALEKLQNRGAKII